ncbi:3-keto-disaccharide hydrolase [Sphingobacterium spiritivorum]|uniref:3-keto-disaccharide hydrolase n=1 Tax=Sphingobacterium spiritivorum TaxID=258 RepID=UPI003DA476EB
MKSTFNYLYAGMAALTFSLGSGAFQHIQAQTKKAAATSYKLLDLPKVDIRKFPKNSKGAYIIFDGKSLEGWRGYNKDHVPTKWGIEDGTIKFTAKPVGSTAGEGGDLIFAHDFKNFELEFEWKISEAGNSGTFFLAKEIEGQPIYISSPEYQLLDNENHPDAKMGVDGNRKSGSLYDMIPAKPQNGKPAGQWNLAKIVVNNGKVTHYQNGEKVVEYTLWTPEWIALLEASKFSSEKWPLAFELLSKVGGKTKSGVIGFQDHGNDVWLKNVTVKVL